MYISDIYISIEVYIYKYVNIYMMNHYIHKTNITLYVN